MARLGLVGLMLLGCVAAATADPSESFVCEFENINFPETVCFVEKCTVAIMNHIKEELDAAFKYMYMGTHFAEFTVDRPGIAKFLLEAATEERSHAVLMLDYLNIRGVRGNFTHYSLNITEEVTGYSLEYEAVLKKAIEMEIQVTDMIYEVVKACDDDYHAADVFTNPILNEQYESMRKLQGALRTLENLKSGHEGEGLQLAEYIFDRKMLNGEF